MVLVAGLDAAKVLTLTAAVAPTIAFYIWHSLQRERYPDPAAVVDAWQADIQLQCQRFSEVFSRSKPAADAYKTLGAQYLQILFLDPRAVLSEPLQPDTAFMPTSEPHEVMRLMLDQLMVSARSIRCQTESQTSCEPTTAEHVDAVLQQSGSNAKPDTKHHMLSPLTRLLHSMGILQKMLWIGGCVPARDHPNCTAAVVALSHVLTGLCKELKDFDHAVMNASASLHASDAANLAALQSEAEHNRMIATLLAREATTWLPKGLQYEGGFPDSFLVLLSALMVKSCKPVYQDVGTVIITKGKCRFALQQQLVVCLAPVLCLI